MLDVTRRAKLALSDMARRAGMKLGAGVIALIGLIYLMAALWSYLARDLAWGPTLASLTIGGVMMALAGLLFVLGAKERHVMPTGEDVTREVQARASLAAEAVMETARQRVHLASETAQQKVASFLDKASYGANRAADGAEARVERLARNLSRRGAEDAARAVGIEPEAVREAVEATGEAARKVRDSRAGPAIGLAGAFAVGLALAAGIARRRHEAGEVWEDDWEEDWDEAGWTDEDWRDG